MSLIVAIPIALIVGFSLGLLGGGGSILTVPALVYLFHLSPKTAIVTSLVVVGITSLVGAVQHGRKGNVSYRIAIVYSLFGILGASATSRLVVVGLIPESTLLMSFAVLMLVVAVVMVRHKPPKRTQFRDPPTIRVSFHGLLTGGLTGALGVGGGFIIMPLLTVGLGLPIHRAIGTSLVVIGANCLAGFLGYVGRVPIQWDYALLFGLFGVLGSLVGVHVAGNSQPRRLRVGFAGFVSLVGVAMLIEQVIQLSS